MKKIMSLFLVVVMLLSVGFAIPASAEEAVDFANAICTIANENGYLVASGEDRGNALTVGEQAKNWRLKGFLGGKYAFIGENELAADVNGASVNEGVTIIQWTSTGAGNQKWILEEAEDGLYYIQSAFSNLYLTETDGVITQELKNEDMCQLWEVSVVGKYEPVVEKMLESEAAKSLSPYRYERLYDFIMSGGEFNLLTYDKVEVMIKERDYFNLSYEEQVAFIEECFKVEPTSLMYGSMATKLKKDIEVTFVGVEENIWQGWHGIPEEAARRYDVKITDPQTGDSHTMLYYSPYDNDEEYAAVVGEAVACFDMPIVKTLWRFIYTSMNTSSWNGGDGTIWNNTGYRGDVNNMVQMFAHELGHVMDNGVRQNTDIWYRVIAQDMVSVTGYGNTNRWEDLAEFSRLYLLAKGDEERIGAIENTYPARTKGYKALLYSLDNEFYADYKDEYETVTYAAGDYDKSVNVMLSKDGKYMTVTEGKLVFSDFDAVKKNWYTWEVYTQSAGKSVLRNKATGDYISFADGKLSVGNKETIGLKKVEGGYMIMEASTGFAIDENCELVPENGTVWTLEEVGDIPFAGDWKIKLSVTGESLTCTEEGLVMGEGSVWSFVPVDKDYFLIMDKETGKTFDISGNSVLSGANAILYSVTGGTNQHFKPVSNGDGSFVLELRHSGLKLTKSLEGFCQSNGELGYVNWILEKVN